MDEGNRNNNNNNNNNAINGIVNHHDVAVHGTLMPNTPAPNGVTNDQWEQIQGLFALGVTHAPQGPGTQTLFAFNINTNDYSTTYEGCKIKNIYKGNNEENYENGHNASAALRAMIEEAVREAVQPLREQIDELIQLVRGRDE